MRRTITNETWEQIKTAYASGIGLRELARNAGISENTVLSRAKREGWTQQIQSAKALAKREKAVAITPVEAVAMIFHPFREPQSASRCTYEERSPLCGVSSEHN